MWLYGCMTIITYYYILHKHVCLFQHKYPFMIFQPVYAEFVESLEEKAAGHIYTLVNNIIFNNKTIVLYDIYVLYRLRNALHSLKV